jgi:hypothetical protein
MTKQLLGVDPLTGTASYVDYDEAEDALHFIEQLNVDGLLDLNRAERSETPKDAFGRDMIRVGRVPTTLLLDLKRRGILDDAKKLALWLNDPDNRFFRVGGGWV